MEWLNHLIRFIAGVRVHVVQKEWFLLERSRALVTFERFLACVIAHVNFESLFQSKRLVAFGARVRFIARVVADVVQERRVAVVFAAAEDAPIDFGTVPRFGIVLSGTRVLDQFSSCLEFVRAVTARERGAIAPFAAMHLQQFVVLKVTAADAATRRIFRLGQLQQSACTLFLFLLFLAVAIQVRLQRHPRHLLTAKLARHLGRIFVHHPDVVPQYVARFVPSVANVALEILLGAVAVHVQVQVLAVTESLTLRVKRNK